MKLINKSRRTGKTTQLIYASAITGFRIIAPNHAMAKCIKEMAKNMGFKIPEPMSDVEYRNRKYDGDHTPILIDDVENEILNEALELYFDAPVVAATMTVPIDDDCCPPTPKPLIFDYSTNKIRQSIGTAEIQKDGSVKIKLKTNRDVFNETFGFTKIYMNNETHLEDQLTIRTEDGEDMKFTDWLDRTYYVEPKEEQNADND